ncbi:MAG: tRNA-intron lyase [Promethearchaeota archaeon]
MIENLKESPYNTLIEMNQNINIDGKIIGENESNIEEKTLQAPSIIKCKLVESSIIVFDYDDATYLYNGGRYFGSPIGIRKPKLNSYFARPLEMSFIEGYYLLSHEKIEIFSPKLKKNITLKELAEHAEGYYDDFIDKYEIYEDLRDNGYVVRPGLKFGADFAVYKKGPGIDHSPFIVQVMPRNVKLSAIDIVRAGRLANSVKKKFIIANASTRTYFGFKWYKP